MSLRLSYTQAVQEAGAIAVVLPAHGFVDDAGALLDRLDGLLFSGGPDLDPATLRRRRRTRGSGPTSTAPATSTSSPCWPPRPRAISRCSPSAAGCRRSTSPAAARCTSTCPTDTQLEHRQTHEPFEPAHAVNVTTNSPLHRLTGRRRLEVNSFHHQAVDRVGNRLQVCAHAPDGTVEAVFDPAAHFCLGVQWHAELLTHRSEHAPLLRALVAAASAGAPGLSLAA